MREYFVSTETFRDQAHKYPRIPIAVGQLVRRYGIRNKSILSLGSRFGREEYWFSRFANRLTLIDVDEKNAVQIEPMLKAAAAGPMRYIIGDAARVPLSAPFDVLFLSGYGPDDLRRSSLKIEHAGRWPSGTPPFEASVLERARLLTAGGLVIIQSFANGYDCNATPGFIEHCDRQLEDHGLRLVELYALARVPGCNLFIIANGLANFPLACPITVFHGRGEDSPVTALRTVG